MCPVFVYSFNIFRSKVKIASLYHTNFSILSISNLFLSFWSFKKKSLVTHQYLIKTIFQAARQDPGLTEGPWDSSLIVNFHFKKFDLPHSATVRLFGKRIDSSCEQGCKEREEICQRLEQRGRGGNSFIYYSWSVIWIFTIATAEPGRDSFPRWRHHMGLTYSVAQGIHICSRPLTPHISVGHKSQVGRDCRL